MSVKPIGDHVLIRMVIKPRETAGGIAIPDVARTDKHEGIVLGKGRGWRDKKGFEHPLDVEIGDRVLVEKRAGQDLWVRVEGGEKEHRKLIRYEDVLAVIEPD